MQVKDIVDILDGEILSGREHLDKEVKTACGSDLMSDVLAFVKDQAVLLTGLVNPQVIRTAEMLDIICIVFIRGKTPPKEVVDLACERGIVIIKTAYRMFPACGLLYSNGLSAGDEEKIT